MGMNREVHLGSASIALPIARQTARDSGPIRSRRRGGRWGRSAGPALAYTKACARTATPRRILPPGSAGGGRRRGEAYRKRRRQEQPLLITALFIRVVLRGATGNLHTARGDRQADAGNWPAPACAETRKGGALDVERLLRWTALKCAKCLVPAQGGEMAS